MVDSEYIAELVDSLRTLLPDARIIGVTTAGEIFEGRILKKKTVISFTIFEKASIKTILVESNVDEYGMGESVTQKIVTKDTKLILLFSDGLFTDGYEIIRSIHDYDREIIVCGGKAGDNEIFQTTYVFTEEGILTKGIAAVSISGKEIQISTQSSFYWSAIGRKMKITKAVKDRIYTIDEIPAIEIYKKYLGVDITRNFPRLAVEFPLILKRDGMEMARVPQEAYEDGSLKVLGDIYEGEEIRFGYGNVNMILSESAEVVKRFSSQAIDLFFVFSCYVRKKFLQNRMALEIEPLNGIAPNYGYFSYGEYLATACSHGVFNVTTQMVGISEYTDDRRSGFSVSKHAFNSKSCGNRDLDLIQVFSNLSNQTIKELQEANEILERQKNELESMHKASNVVMDINNQILYSCKPEKLYEIILGKVMGLIPNADMGSILTSKNGILQYLAASGYDSEYVREVRYQVDDSNFFTTYKKEGSFEPRIVNIETELKFSDPLLMSIYDRVLVEKPAELLTCGIHMDGDDVAVINLFTCAEHRFSKEDMSILKYVAYEIGMVFSNTKYLESILYLSRHDRLTGVFSRGYFLELVHEAQKKCVLNNGKFTIAFFDLNNFKDINDTFGHDIGDLYLIKFAAILKSMVENTDFLGRIGGDEFEVVFMDKTKSQVMKIMEDISEKFKNNPFVYNNFSREISYAFGLAEFPEDDPQIRALVRIADSQMYKNKQETKSKSEKI